MAFRAMLAVIGAGLLGACSAHMAAMEKNNTTWNTLDGKPPLIIAHRGASGYLPEHTLEAYTLAIEQGADIIEPDLVFTKDGVLVARHDRYLSTTTDVADHPEFADRKRANPDRNGAPRNDWWVEDFTLAEIKTLRARQPFPGRSKEFDDFYEIPTFKEMLALIEEKAAAARRSVGVYPETKHPGYFNSIGLDFEAPLLAALEGFKTGPVFIQSFEPEILKRLNGKTNAKLVQLIYEETPGAGPNIPLAEIAEYADGVGPSKDLLGVTKNGDESLLVSNAHNLGMIIHPWTFRDDVPNENITYVLTGIVTLGDEPTVHWDSTGNKDSEQVTMGDLFDEAAQEYKLIFSAGVDGVFTDFPDTAHNIVNSRNLTRSLTKK